MATLHRSLERHGYSVGALHGDMDQHARLRTLDSFRDGQIKLLVASDVAARGLDIPAVSHIFNFDVPTHSEDYVHRIGRTGRAGRQRRGADHRHRAETKYVQSIEKLTGKPIEWADSAAADSLGAGAPLRESEWTNADADRESRGDGVGVAKPTSPRGHDGEAATAASREDGDGRPARNEPTAHGSDAAAQPSSRCALDRRPRSRRADRRINARAVGFSDHVPAFLLRPVRMPSEAEALEEV